MRKGAYSGFAVIVQLRYISPIESDLQLDAAV